MVLNVYNILKAQTCPMRNGSFLSDGGTLHVLGYCSYLIGKLQAGSACDLRAFARPGGPEPAAAARGWGVLQAGWPEMRDLTEEYDEKYWSSTSSSVVPHKAVAEVSKIETYRRGWLLWMTDGRANALMDWKVVGVVFFWSGYNGCSGHVVGYHNCWM
jgi:hypothetical protein